MIEIETETEIAREAVIRILDDQGMMRRKRSLDEDHDHAVAGEKEAGIEKGLEPGVGVGVPTSGRRGTREGSAVVAGYGTGDGAGAGAGREVVAEAAEENLGGTRTSTIFLNCILYNTCKTKCQQQRAR